MLNDKNVRNCKLQEVDSWMSHWLGSVGMLKNGVTFNLGFVTVCSPAIFETYSSDHKNMWVTANDYYIYFQLIMLDSLTTIL